MVRCRAGGACHKHTFGFTLIEMMATLVLLALLAGVVLPSFQRWFEGLETRVEASEMATRLQRLYSRTALLGVDWRLDASTLKNRLPDGEVAVQLPPGWDFAPGAVLELSAGGFCAPAQIAMTSPRGPVTFLIDGQTCSVSVARVGTLTP